ncbi:MAG: hypothetical protein ACREKH_08295, partial [Candidatus Rokuibacteriota bacterium]
IYLAELWYFVASPDPRRFDSSPLGTAHAQPAPFADVLRTVRGVGARARRIAGRAIAGTRRVTPAS